jgi:CRP/FNR family transcriptional regulator, cyclic AMP receptor protein
MMTAVERVLVLRGADLLKDVGPRRLLALAEVAREVEMRAGERLFGEDDPADAMYMVVAGRVRIRVGERVLSEVGPGESFGTWALVDDSERGQIAECLEDGLALALHRDEFYDVASGDFELLKEVVRSLARRLRALVSERPEEARIEGEGIEKPAVLAEAEAAPAETVEPATPAAAPTAGATLEAAALGQPVAPASDAAQDPGPRTPTVPPTAPA